MIIVRAPWHMSALAHLVLWLAALLAATAGQAAEGRGDAAGQWDSATATTLLTYIEQVGSHGLKPADYQPARLRAALASQDAGQLDSQAGESFARLATDLAVGRVDPGSRGRYFIPANTIDPLRIDQLTGEAIAARQVAQVLDSLAPQNPAYSALRRELASGDALDKARRGQLLASLERWRWLPRDFGGRYLLVNIPEYRLRLIDGGRETQGHRVIVGKVSTATAQFHADVTAVILNPAWHVPASIIRESVGSLVRNRPGEARRRGYSWTYAGGRLQVTQGPGPGNSLGQMKLDMPNPQSMFIHDTPSKDLFAREDRALSHGCMRVDNPFDLAQALLAGVGWDRARIDAVVATRETTPVALDVPVPVYVVYLTAMPQADGTVAYLKDPYRLDAAVLAGLDQPRR